MRKICTFLLLISASFTYAQKKPLDHSVYDKWESTGEKKLSNNGSWAAYTINQQEGDGTLYLFNALTNNKKSISRGQGVIFTNDSKFAAFNIKPWYADIRMAKIKKKKADDQTKDTLAIANLTSGDLIKIARVESFKIPEKGPALLAYLMEKPVDSSKKNAAARPTRNEDESGTSAKKTEGTDLTVKFLSGGPDRVFKYVTDYAFNKTGKYLVYAAIGSKKDKTAPVGVYLLNTETGKVKNLVALKGNYSSFEFDESGEYIAFLGEQSPEKAENKDFKIYYSSKSLDTAQAMVENDLPGMPDNWSVSGNRNIGFSKDGKQLFFGIAPVRAPKDTTLIDIDHAKLDIWGYKDDYLQPQQVKNASRELKRSYLAAFDIFNADPKIIPLADEKMTDVMLPQEGNGRIALGSSDFGQRMETQWTGGSNRDYFLVDLKTGERRNILKKLDGNAMLSPMGNYVVYFDKNTGHWNSYSVSTGNVTVLTSNLPVKFYQEDNDVPDKAGSYGFAGWSDDEKAFLINDKFDIWMFSMDGKNLPVNATNGYGRRNNLTLRYKKTNNEDKFIHLKSPVLFEAFNNTNKDAGYYEGTLSGKKDPVMLVMSANKYTGLSKARDADRYIYEKSSYSNSPNVFISTDLKSDKQISETNPQQNNYNWGTAELVKWTTPKGYASEGILYKPENFDKTKKYPMIVYFYEKLSDGLNTYIAPAPTPSRLNISYFVSNGYLVFTPDISYETGHPGASAEEFINSGVESLKKNTWVDGSKIGIQGQSWGGYQVAHLITRTNMYAAAWSGAPVVNMTSAYGGIRWESGMNRQFQYEKTQSRIGATLWERPDLYIENSPLFAMPKVSTPVVIMSNDADGAVPWYQGIEMFTALKRLGKPAWLLNYNGEAHNLVQRQNKKDIQIREQQFFDHYLKGAKAPVWMTSGIPATEKGRNWGFELTDDKP